MRVAAASIAIALAMTATAARAEPEEVPGPKPWLGITYRPAQWGGAVVTEVHPGTPAAAVGLRAGDVLLAADGADIMDLGELMRVATVGARMTLVLDRGGRRVVVRPLLGVRPTSDELVHQLLVGRDLPILPARDVLGRAVRGKRWRGAPRLLAVFDARCAACVTVTNRLAATQAAAPTAPTVQALVLADSVVEFDAMRALTPVTTAAWRVERTDGAGLLAGIDPSTDGVVIVSDGAGVIRFAAVMSSGDAHDGACQVLADLNSAEASLAEQASAR